MSAHTPGPWSAERNTYNTVVRVPYATVALVMVANNGDAELIASAPDLLAALEALCPTVLSGTPGMLEAISAAEKAIARARGGK